MEDLEIHLYDKKYTYVLSFEDNTHKLFKGETLWKQGEEVERHSHILITVGHNSMEGEVESCLKINKIEGIDLMEVLFESYH